MPITIENNIFTLKTQNTEYVIGIYENRFPIHLYYGKIDDKKELEYKNCVLGFSPFHEEFGLNYLTDTAFSEFSFYGSGDFRSNALKVRNLKTGSFVTRFYFDSASKFKGRISLEGLPYADADDETETLLIVLKDIVLNAKINLYYTIFPRTDVISRYFVLDNNGESDIKIEKCMMMCLDIPSADFDLISFYGKHAGERNFQRTSTIHGKQCLYSNRGASSHQLNPFFMLCDKDTTEENGSCYGFNIVYSGSFLNEVEVDQLNTTRVLSGLGSDNFEYLLKPNESFCSPEAIVTYSEHGLGQVSRNMHKFAKNHIIPNKKHPLVLNSWEAFYFDIEQEKLIEFAKEASKIGMDTVVMDDGWFGARINDKAGLGDWYCNKERFPNGLSEFVHKVKSTGVNFGIWIEPEMVNKDSDLYRNHPSWVMQDSNYNPLLGRYQLVLDMANYDVISYLKDILSKTFKDVPIDYIKYDMNRHITDCYSPSLPPERQGETAYRYMLGVYKIFSWLCTEFPNAVIENCSGGGGRFDLGMMKYSTLIWTSDNTSPKDRVYIQHGTTYGYPPSVMSCHVANHPTIDYCFNVAINGPLGYELNVLKSDQKDIMKRQIEVYNCFKHLILNGNFYRIQNPWECGRYSYYFTNDDATEILISYLQNEADQTETENILRVPVSNPDYTYIDQFTKEKYRGIDLIDGLKIKSSKTEMYGKILYLKAEC